MPPPPPIPASQQKLDSEHLNLLAIFHFICAGLALLGIGMLFFQITMMHTMMDNPAWQNAKNPPPKEFFAIFRVLFVVFGIWFVVSCFLNLASGLALRAKKHRTFSFVVAVLNCLHIPIGTVLGIFTIIALSRPSVRELYEKQGR